MPADRSDRRRRTIFRMDLDFVVTDWLSDELFGLGPEDIVGRLYWDRISGDAHRMHRLRILRETGRFAGIAVVADEHNEHVAVRANVVPIWRDEQLAGWRVDLREVFDPDYFPDFSDT